MKKIALFGGAFDPIHEGHLHIAKLAQKELSLDKIYFIPLNQAVHKQQPGFSNEDRVSKIKDLIKNYPYFEIITDEITRGGASYTIDTVNDFLKNNSNTMTQVDLYYIIGSDAFELFFTWKEPYKLLSLVKFIVVSRPGYDFSKIEKMFAKSENREYLDRIFFIEDKGLDISSTKIREQMNVADKNKKI